MNNDTTLTANSKRTLFAIDVENLCSEAFPPPSYAAAMIRRVLGLGGYRRGDHLMVASNRYLARDLVWLIQDLPHHYWIAGPGRDAADRQLQRAVIEQVDRFDHVVIATGDGGFTDLVERCRSNGLRTDVVANRFSLSRRLVAACDRALFLV